MVSHFGSFKKKSGRIWLCSFKRGFSLRGRAAQREKRSFSSRFLCSPCFALSSSLSLCPRGASPRGVPQPRAPRAREAQPLLRHPNRCCRWTGCSPCPALPSLEAPLGGKWEEKGKAGLWLPVKNESAERQRQAGREGCCMLAEAPRASGCQSERLAG